MRRLRDVNRSVWRVREGVLYLFQPSFMQKGNRDQPGGQVSILAQDGDRIVRLDEREAIITITHERFRIRVVQGTEPTGIGYFYALCVLEFEIGNRWKTLLVVDERHLDPIYEAFNDLIEYLELRHSVPPDEIELPDRLQTN